MDVIVLEDNLLRMRMDACYSYFDEWMTIRQAYLRSTFLAFKGDGK